jgi:plastocyanin
MKRLLGSVVVVLTVVAGLGFGPAWAAETKVRVSREENKPRTIEVKVGDEVSWVNGTGGTAHVEFAHTGLAFYIGSKEGTVKFEKPGTYEYTVHIAGVKSHAHMGTIVVK